MDIAIINLAMPLIQGQFTLENDKVLWLQTLYILPYGGFLIIGGKLADIVGRKKIFTIGSVLFLFTSLGAGLSSSFEMLAMFRAIQGVAAAFVLPSALSIITNTFSDSTARSKAIGIFGAFAAIGSGLGMSVGGIISTLAGWQWAFLINVPVIGISLVLGYFYIDNDSRSKPRVSPDILSAIFLTTAIIALSFVVHDLANAVQHWLLLTGLDILILAALASFFYRSSRLENPLIDFSLFRNRNITVANIATVVMGSFFTGFLFIISLVFQNNMDYSAANAGMLLFPFSVLSALSGKFLFPQLMKRMNMSTIAVLGMTIMLSGGVLLVSSLYLDYFLPVILFSIACVTGVGMAICFPSFTVLALGSIPAEQHGLASSVSSTCYFFGGGLGLSFLGLFMQISGSATTVTAIPVFVLCSFALMGLVVLLFAKNTVVKPS
ncbi:MFS transporter [Cytophagales bacterium WSM2-2]|nr:MFS transporter [Cytophagales bacterium WSM2-2]